MYTKFITFFLLISICLNLNAQEKNYFGARLGLSSMYVSESTSSASGNYDNRLGFTTGLFVELGLSKYFSIQPELDFTNKGYKYSTGQSINIKLNYLEIPVILKPKFPIEEALEIYGELGPSLSIGMGGEAVVNGVSYSDLFGKDGYNSLDFGLNYGAGFNVKLKSKYKFGIGIRFFKGLSELYPTNPQNISGKNNGFILGFNFLQSL